MTHEEAEVFLYLYGKVYPGRCDNKRVWAMVLKAMEVIQQHEDERETK